MQVSILNGIYADSSPQLRTAYPVNCLPVPKGSGVSEGYLRPGDGIVRHATGPGMDRGGINWKGRCYRVMGDRLVIVEENGAVTNIGFVGGPASNYVTFDYSFDRLAVSSGGRLYYWNGTTLSQVTDPDLGTVISFVWVDGYFMTTDGTYLVVTELNDPTQVNPLKYGSSEADPDPVKALLKLRNEVYALNRYTIEVFDNVGGSLFPFQRIEGAQIQKGVIGTHACCVYQDNIAFLGGGRNEAPGIYIGANANCQKISTQEIDELLLSFTETQLAGVKLEARNDRAHQLLYVHLPDRTVVFDAAATQALGQPIWFVLTSAMTGFERYRARNFVWAYNKWLVGDTESSDVGYTTITTSSHWGDVVRWEFNTAISYNEGRGAVFNQMELVSLTGSVELGSEPTISTSYSLDGQNWSQEKFISVGKSGNTNKRLCWFQCGFMRNYRIQRFKGTSQAHLSFLRLEVQAEPLAY